MKALKWIMTAVTALLVLALLGAAYAAVWVHGDDSARLGATAMVTFFVLIPAGTLTVFLWDET